MSFNITLVATEYQEIHLYSAVNIESVKINTAVNLAGLNFEPTGRAPLSFPRHPSSKRNKCQLFQGSQSNPTQFYCNLQTHNCDSVVEDVLN